MAAKRAKAMGAEVTVFTRAEEKRDEAARLGVAGILEDDKDALKGLKARFDSSCRPCRKARCEAVRYVIDMATPKPAG